MLPDDQNGTSIHALKTHLNNIGYVPQQMNQAQTLAQQTQQIQQAQAIQQQQMQALARQAQELQQLRQKQHAQMAQQQAYQTKSSKKDLRKADITHLVSDINKSLDNYSPSNQDVPVDDGTEEEIEEMEADKEKNANGNSYSYLPEWLKDILIILVIYVILSQNTVKTFVGKYINSINPGSDGTVSFLGIVIYGTLLAVLYVIIRKIV